MDNQDVSGESMNTEAAQVTEEPKEVESLSNLSIIKLY